MGYDRKELKRFGKSCFAFNYWACVLVAATLVVIVTLLVFGAGIFGTAFLNNLEEKYDLDIPYTYSAASEEEPSGADGAVLKEFMKFFVAISLALTVIRVLFWNPLRVGAGRFFVENGRGLSSGAKDMLWAFSSRYGRTVWTCLLRDLFLLLWSLLIIPGIVKSYSYRMVPYILAEDGSMPALEAITESRRMMNGRKMDAFLFDLSFAGWFALNAVTMGIAGILYVHPYFYSSQAAFYEFVKAEKGGSSLSR